MIKTKSRLVNCKFWDDKYTSNLDPIEKLLFLYFLTNPLTNLIGVYEIELRRIAFDTGIDKEMVNKIIDRFSRDKKIYYFDGYIIIKNFVKFQNEGSEKIKIGIKNLFEALPENIKKFNSELLKGIDTLSHINTNINNNINSNNNSNNNSNSNNNMPEKTPAEIDFEKVMNHWNSFAKEMDLPQIKEINKSRRNKIICRSKEAQFDFNNILNEIRQSDFLTGKKTDFKINFDWVFKSQNNYTKIIEGNYRNGKFTNNDTGNSKGFDIGKNTWIAGTLENALQLTRENGN